MFRFSFNKIPVEGEKTNEFPLITALNFANIASKQEIAIPPIVCSSCACVLIYKEDLKPTAKGYSFECRFCLTKNDVSKADGDVFLGNIPSNAQNTNAPPMSGAELCFLLDQIKEKDEKKNGIEAPKSTGTFPIQVAIIDVSGSMGGGKIEAVKHALVQNIHEIAAEMPKINFILVPFSTNVTVYPDPESKIAIPDGPHFFKEEDMQKKAAEIIKTHKLKPLESNYDAWTSIVKKISVEDMTALGPALYIGTALIIETQRSQLKKLGGKALLLTDGLANIGLGSIERINAKDEKHKSFYIRIAEICMQNNIIVDMVGVRDPGGGNSVALDIIGKITDYTGGKMAFISADQIESAFAEFQRTNFVAKNVVLKIFAPPLLELEEIQGVEVLEPLPKQNGKPIRLGAFDAEREIYLKFKPSKEKPTVGKKIPIQIQLEFFDANNQHKIRLIQQEIEIVADQDSFQKSFDAKVSTAYELSKAAGLRRKGDFGAAKKQAAMTKVRNANLGKKFDQSTGELNALVEDEEDEWDANEKASEQVADKKSFFAAQEQSLNRVSFDMKMARLKKKKEEK